MGWFSVLFIISTVLLSLYCIVGMVMNKSKTGVCRAPHEDFWASCLTCKCLGNKGCMDSNDNGFTSTFGSAASGGNPYNKGVDFNRATQNPDARRSSGYGTA